MAEPPKRSDTPEPEVDDDRKCADCGKVIPDLLSSFGTERSTRRNASARPGSRPETNLQAQRLQHLGQPLTPP